jgi:hypothetical protein
MQIDKQQIIDHLREQGDQDKATQAEGQLPEQVDTEQHAGMLQNLGINPQDLIAKFMGGGGLPGM